MAAVLVDLPLFLVAPLRRRRHRTWGATADELAAPMPGDDVLPIAQYRSTRAITISAPAEDVWPWLVQVGYRRGGRYAHDLLDDFARPSAREIVPDGRGRLPEMRRMLRGIRRRAEVGQSRRISPEPGPAISERHHRAAWR